MFAKRMMLSLISAILVISTCAIAAETTTKAEPKTPTLDETIKWISDKLSSSGGYNCVKDDKGASVEYSSLERGKGTTVILTYTNLIYSGDKSYSELIYTFTIPLSDLDAPGDPGGPSGSFGCQDAKLYHLYLETKGSLQTIKGSHIWKKHYSSGKVDEHKSIQEDDSQSLSIDFADKDTANRIKKAFDHAIKLAQSEELF